MEQLETVIKELREIFNVSDFQFSNAYQGFEEKGNFYINKDKMSRQEVIEKLQNYFNGISVKNVSLHISPITFVFTKFSLRNVVSD